jgi:benzoate membrane transport protein
MAEAVGAFMVCAALITLAGVTGLFERLMNRIPMAIASALLAGVLARFGLQAFAAAQTALPLVLLMLATYLGGKRLVPRYAVPATLAAAVAFVALRGDMAWGAVTFQLAVPQFTAPVFTLSAAISLALPLFVVTMASQNLPGVAAQRACGYDIPISPVVGATGLASFLLAPFGGYALNLAAITAAICMGKEAHADPSRRYTASVAAGLLYIALGLAGGTIVSLMAAFPQALILAVAGLALLGTMASGLAVAVKDEQHREAALLTFLVTLSGVTLMGVGSAFWGVVVGGLAQWLWTRRQAASH